MNGHWTLTLERCCRVGRHSEFAEAFECALAGAGPVLQTVILDSDNVQSISQLVSSRDPAQMPEHGRQDLRKACRTFPASANASPGVIVPAAARRHGCALVSYRDLTEERNNFLRALPQVLIRDGVCSTGQLYWRTDIDDLVPEEYAEHSEHVVLNDI